MNLSTIVVAAFSMLFSPLLLAQQDSSEATISQLPDRNLAVIGRQMAVNFPAKELVSIKAVAAGAIYQLEFAGGLVIYALAGSDYFLAGNLYQGTEAQVVNVTEQIKQQQRAELLAQLQPHEYLSLEPLEQPAKAVVYVFVDIDCYYCQYQHQESQQLLAQGVEVRYLSLNRQKTASAAYHKVRRTWCSDEPQQALDWLMQGRSVAEQKCTLGLMAKHQQLATQAGVKRLPAIMTEDGRLISGLLRAPQIFNLLDIALPEALIGDASLDLQNSMDITPVGSAQLPPAAE